MIRPFIIHALPRSRTAWLSRFLSYRDWTCAHEAAITLRKAADIPGFFLKPQFGTAETATAQGHWLIDYYCPGIKHVVIRRRTDDVVKSMMAVEVGSAGFHYDENRLRRIMAYGNRMLDQISAKPGTLTVDFEDMVNEKTCAEIFEFCLPYSHDGAWWGDLHQKNIQVDVKSVLLYYHANREGVEGFKRDCKADLLRLRRKGLIGKGIS